MREELLKRYNEELSYLRTQGQAFAQAYPKIANRLRLGPGQVEDPFVGRLIEGFAFLTARVRTKLDHEHNTIIQTLINLLYPHYLLPVPAMTIMAITPKDQLDKSYTVPRHAELTSTTLTNQTCHFRTCYPVTLNPITLAQCRYQKQTHISAKRPSKNLKSALTLTFQASKPDQPVIPNQLRLFIDADVAQANLIYELLFNALDQIVLTTPNAEDHIIELPKSALQPVGFDDDQALLPYPPQSFSGYRLLTEYFTFPQKFHFFDIENLQQHLPQDWANEWQLCCFFNKHLVDLENIINSKTFKLHCTPIINLFEQIGEPIQYNHLQTDYHVVADAHKNIDNIEVYALEDLNLASEKYAKEVSCSPYFGKKFLTQLKDQRIYWQVMRKSCWEIGAYNTPGNETFVSLSQINLPQPITENIALIPRLLCTNRTLAEHLPFGTNDPVLRFWSSNHELVERMQGITAISRPQYRDLNQTTDIDLIAHLSLNQLNVESQTETLDVLKEILALYHYDNEFNGLMINNALVNAQYRRCTERHPLSLKQGFCQGIELSLTLDESQMLDNNAYLFGCILHRFLAKFSSINSFVKLKLLSLQRGEINRWPAILGTQKTC